MTNTHINVGGHKITTNKVGNLHRITTYVSANLSNSADTSGIWWCVLNGVCYVLIDNIISSSTGGQIMTRDLPPPKHPRVIAICYDNRGDIYSSYTTKSEFTVNVFIANTNLSSMFSYPVADDWVES